jgi:hypothetical protein
MAQREGRPLKFPNVEELQKKIDEYFSVTPKDEVTITGLAIALDTSRETLCNYEKKDEFFDAIKKAKYKVVIEYELDLRRKGRSGDMFALKNFGWQDKNETELSGEITQTQNINLSPERLELAKKLAIELKKEI